MKSPLKSRPSPSATVHAALAYYFDHIEEIRAKMLQEADYVEEFMRNNPSALQVKLQKMLGDKAR